MADLFAKKTSTHVLIRTSPKGQAFVGRCPKCGRTGLTLVDDGYCDNQIGSTAADDLMMAIREDDRQ